MTEELKTIKVYKAESNLIRLDTVSSDFVEAAINRYKVVLYEEKACDRCELLDQRHSEPCDNCDNYLGTRQLGKVVVKGETKYLSVPLGGIKKFSNLLTEHGLKGRSVPKYGEPDSFKHSIQMTREPREWQLEAVEVALEKKRGMIIAPPRAGKTIFGVLLTTRLNVKTIIIASQRDWLTQFRNSYVGSPGEAAFTNLNPKRIAFCKTVEDFENHDVCLCTFQQFMNPSGALILEKISRMPGLVIVDECFTADHEVLTTDGYVGIKDIAENPTQYSVPTLNHNTGAVEPKRVYASTTKKTKTLIEVDVDGITYRCTPNHPWWSVTRNAYVEAKDIKVGETVYQLGESAL